MHPTDEFLEFIDKSGVTFEQASEEHKTASTAHNKLGNSEFREEHRA